MNRFSMLIINATLQFPSIDYILATVAVIRIHIFTKITMDPLDALLAENEQALEELIAAMNPNPNPNPNPPQPVHIPENARLENLHEELEDYVFESTLHANTRGDGVSPELE